jgi:hypothetical protein
MSKDNYSNNTYFWMRMADLYEEKTTIAETPEDYNSFAEEKISGDKRAISTFKNLEEIPCIFKVDEGFLCDYLPNNMGYPLMSYKLKEVIDSNVVVKIHRWLRAKVKDTRVNKVLIYYMPLFENKVDSIDYERSKYFDEEKTDLVVPCFSLKKIIDLDFFPKHNELSDKEIGEKTPYFVDRYLIVSKKLKNIITKSKLTGIRFEEEWVVNDLNEKK